MRNLFIAPVLVAMLAACSHGHHKKDHAKHMKRAEDKIARELNLNEDQKAKLNAVFEAKKAMKDSVKPQTDEINKEMQVLVEAPKLDRAKLKQLMDRKEKVMVDHKDDFWTGVYPKLEAFHASLSTEQRQKASECLEKHKHKMF